MGKKRARFRVTLQQDFIINSMPNDTKCVLSIIILNYNASDYLVKCIDSIYNSDIPKSSYEIVVVDNNSNDNSIQLAKKIAKENTHFFELKSNKGFAYGNNVGVSKINSFSKYVLFLNPDTIVNSDTLQKCIDYLRNNKQVDALTCKIILAKTNSIQPECHRGFPTPWRALCYFSNLYKLFPKSRLLNGYFLGNLDMQKPHAIEACVGAFILIKREVGGDIKWWDERYFFYGEDLDLCYQLKKNNYNLYYYPYCEITHYQGITSGLKQHTKDQSTASKETRARIAKASTDAMFLFYEKNLKNKYPKVVYLLTIFGIKLLQKIRLWQSSK